MSIGALAQLIERFAGSEEVRSLNLLRSTIFYAKNNACYNKRYEYANNPYGRTGKRRTDNW